MTTPTPPTPPAYAPLPAKPSNGMAIAALALGIAAIVIGIWALIPLVGLVAAFLAFLPAVLAAIFGHIGVAKSKSMDGTGKGMAVTGFILGYVTIALIVLTTVWWIVAIAITGAGSGTHYS